MKYTALLSRLSYSRSVVVLITGGNLFLYDTETHKWERLRMVLFGITVKESLYT